VGYSGSMGRSLTRNAVLKELAVVGDKLAARALNKEKRLALLRRQAELGDLRDALAERARRKLAS
jgi:cell division protein FtsB